MILFNTRLMGKKLITLTILMLAFSNYANAYERERFCTGIGYSQEKDYISAIFTAEFVDEHVKQFEDFVKQKYGDSLSFTSCQGDGFKKESDIRISPYKIVDTGWKPEPFERQALRDFHISVSGSDREIEVCVRDHECEDGDRIEVSVNGDTVFRGEIDNDWNCETTSVSKGRNSIKMYAINGSGNKGSCSYADINTGEIRIKGNNTQSQQWKHRGGKGSSADIIVDIN